MMKTTILKYNFNTKWKHSHLITLMESCLVTNFLNLIRMHLKSDNIPEKRNYFKGYEFGMFQNYVCSIVCKHLMKCNHTIETRNIRKFIKRRTFFPYWLWNFSGKMIVISVTDDIISDIPKRYLSNIVIGYKNH